MNWIQSAWVGFLSGLSELLPVSAQAHRGLYCHMMGVEAAGLLQRLCCHIAILAVLLLAGNLELRRLYRTHKLLKTPTRRRTGRPELNSGGTLRMLRSAVLLAVLGRLLSVPLSFIGDRLWMLLLPLLLSGLILWLPTQMPTANKDGRHLTAADGALMGLGALLAAIPGLSGVGAVTAIGSMRGARRDYALRFAWILSGVGLATAIVMDLVVLARTGFSAALPELLTAAAGGLAAAVGAFLAIQLARALIRPGRSGLGIFCYFNWGLALLCGVLFLLV